MYVGYLWTYEKQVLNFLQCSGSLTFWYGSGSLGSGPLTKGSGSGSCYFHHWPAKHQQKRSKKSFSVYSFFQVHLHHSSHFTDKKSRRSLKNSRNKVFSYYFFLMIGGSGPVPLTTGSRKPKILRIRSTDFLYIFFTGRTRMTANIICCLFRLHHGVDIKTADLSGGQESHLCPRTQASS